MKKPKKKIPICPRTEDVDQLTDSQSKALLLDIMNKLDDLSMEDFFGTEGWRKYLGYKD